MTDVQNECFEDGKTTQCLPLLDSQVPLWGMSLAPYTNSLRQNAAPVNALERESRSRKNAQHAKWYRFPK